MAEYIEREAAVNLILETPFTMSMCLSEQECHGMNRAKQIIARLVEQSIPAASVRENVKGEWDMDSVAFYRKCPNCKCCVRDNRYEVFLDNGDLHFCPNCGAEMTGGNDG